MRGYFITDEQMEDLHRRIELAYTRVKTGRTMHTDPLDDVYRAINYHVRDWEAEVGKN